MLKDEAYPSLLAEENAVEDEAQPLHAVNDWRRRFFVFLVIAILEFALILVMIPQLRSRPSHLITNGEVVEPYSPAEGHVKYINKRLTTDPDSFKFMGSPRKELDEAWHDLLEGTMIRVTAEELLAADNATSIAHKEGGFVAGLGISHDLHCLKRIKQSMYQEYYYPNASDDVRAEVAEHAEHCLESLRQAIMCSADLSLYTLAWTPHSRSKPAVRVAQQHMCVAWDPLHDWMKSRASRFDEMVGVATGGI